MVLLVKVATSILIYQTIPSQVANLCKYFTKVWHCAENKVQFRVFIKYDVLRDLLWFVELKKNAKNIHEWMLLLVNLQGKVCKFTKSNTPPWVILCFLNGPKCHQSTQSVSYMLSNSQCENVIAQRCYSCKLVVKIFAKFTGKYQCQKCEKLFLSSQFWKKKVPRFW